MSAGDLISILTYPPCCSPICLCAQATNASGAKRPRPSQQLRRRNSTGTIFLSHTMSNQDNNATIECVCVVIRAHMLGECPHGPSVDGLITARASLFNAYRTIPLPLSSSLRNVTDAAKENVVPLPEYDVFKDANFQTPAMPARVSRRPSGNTTTLAASTAQAAAATSPEAMVSITLLCLFCVVLLLSCMCCVHVQLFLFLVVDFVT